MKWKTKTHILLDKDPLMNYLALWQQLMYQTMKNLIEVVSMLEWETDQSYMTQDKTQRTLIQNPKTRLELYQSRS